MREFAAATGQGSVSKAGSHGHGRHAADARAALALASTRLMVAVVAKVGHIERGDPGHALFDSVAVLATGAR